MKITSINYNEEDKIIIVWTKEFPDYGFHFKINDLIDKADLITKVEAKVQTKQTGENTEAQQLNKFKSLK